MARDIPEINEYNNFQSKVSKISPYLPRQIEKAIQKTPFDEARALMEIKKDTDTEDDFFIDDWFQSFYTDLVEAAKSDMEGLHKVQETQDRIKNVIDNKLKELECRYLSDPESNTLLFNERMHSYLSKASALGADIDSIIKIKNICNKHELTKEDLRVITGFQANMMILTSSRNLLGGLSDLKEADDKNVKTLATIYETRLKYNIRLFLDDPDSENIGKNITKIQSQIASLQYDLEKILKELPPGNPYYETLKIVADFSATVLIPYYSTAKMVYSMSQGENYTAEDIAKIVLLDTAFLCPTGKLLGMTMKGTGMVKTGERILKIAEKNKALYEIGNLTGVALSSCLLLLEQYKTMTDKSKKNDFKELIINILKTSGYIICNGINYYLIKKNLNAGNMNKVKKIFTTLGITLTEVGEETIEADLKSNE